MGTSYFKGKGGGPPIVGSSTQQLARGLNAGQYGTRSAGVGAQKDVAAAMAINKAGAFKPLKRTAAYPAGPKT
jgi:hypothetical protein